MLAPTRLVLALGAVVGPVLSLVVHLINVVEALGLLLLLDLSGGLLLHDIVLPEVVQVAVLRLELVFELSDLLLSGRLGLTVLFLNVCEAKKMLTEEKQSAN